jgi:YhcH/YjgK/YiaL family protein
MFAVVAQYQTRDFESAEPEAHRRFLDVQYLISGKETVFWTPLEEAGEVTSPYDADRDILFFQRNDRGRAGTGPQGGSQSPRLGLAQSKQ